MSPLKVFTVLATTATLLCVQGKEMIVDYEPMNPVHDIMNIAYDLKALGKVLDTEKDFNRAFRIYKEGGYSESIAKLELREELPFFVDKGTVITATSISEIDVTAVALDDYEIGDREIKVLYNQDENCFVGGLEEPDTSGCFMPSGSITITGGKAPVPYFYNVDFDNTNLRTLENLSKEAESEFTVDGHVDQGFFAEFAKFEDYFGSATYADDILTAVFRGNKHTFTKHVYDFRDWNDDDRAWFVEHGTDFLNIAMHIVGQLEQVKNTCVEGCSGKTCNAEAIQHLDTAVAFYTGSLYQEHDEGNMMYGLADQMCHLFKTCGWSVDQTEGTSHVNLLNFVKFKDAQKKLLAGQCNEADLDLRVVAKMVFIPLWQGLLFAAYHGHRKEGTVFASATLPILAHCSPGYVEKIFGYFLPDAKEKIHFPYMKKIMEDHFHCIALDCRNVGGLWNHGKEQYHGHAEPCDQTNIHPGHYQEGPSGGAVFAAVAFCFAVLVGGIVIIRRMRWNRAARESAKDPDADDNIAVGESRGEII